MRSLRSRTLTSYISEEGGENNFMSDFEDYKIMYQCSRQKGIDDGILVEILKNRWQELSGDKPIIATSHLYHNVSLAGLLEIWNEFVEWRKNIMPKLPEEKQMFTTSMNFEKVWVIEDGEAFTLMYPSDYW